MIHPLKTRYALKAVLELAKRHETGEVVRLSDVALAQNIPERFLENILVMLKQGGFVESVRGRHGGFQLAREPINILAGQVIRFCSGAVDEDPIADDPFAGMWREADAAAQAVYDRMNFQELVESLRCTAHTDFAI